MIVQSVAKLLPDSFRVILQLSASERYAKILQLPAIDKDTTTKGLYVDVLTIPTSSNFWEKTDALLMDKPTDHPLDGMIHIMYVGSATRDKGFQHRVQYQHQNVHRRSTHPSFHYAAMEAAVTSRFGIITTADNDEPAPLVRIAEAVVIACLHTYNLAPYTKILKKFGILTGDSKAWGLNRSGALKDGTPATVKPDAAVLGLEHIVDEIETNQQVSYENLHEVVKEWLEKIQNCTNAEAAEAFLQKFPAGFSISRAIVTTIYRSMQKKMALEQRQKSALCGTVYRFATENELEVVRVKCPKCASERDDENATCGIESGLYVARYFHCKICPKTDYGNESKSAFVPTASQPYIGYFTLRERYNRQFKPLEGSEPTSNVAPLEDVQADAGPSCFPGRAIEQAGAESPADVVHRQSATIEQWKRIFDSDDESGSGIAADYQSYTTPAGERRIEQIWKRVKRRRRC
jgi:hypothetical protein